MMEKLNPRIDLVFKKIFGREENKDLLIALINATVGPESQVADLTLLNPYNDKNFKDDKLSILDIKAKSLHGEIFNIEIQITDEADYDKRALYYWAKLYTDQLKTAEDYSKLQKVIGIHILNFTSILDSGKYHNVFEITEKETGVRYFNDLELHTIELTKFSDNLKGDLRDFAGKIKTALDRWSTFLTKHDLLNADGLPESLDVPELKKALSVLNVMNFSEQEREAYENRLKWLRIEANTLNKYEQKGLEKGREEGRAEGLEKGLEKGRAEGLEKGREEEKLAIASSLLGKGMSSQEVAEVTSLSLQQIEALDKKNGCSLKG